MDNATAPRRQTESRAILLDGNLGKWFRHNMQLIGFTANKNNFHFVRNLSEEELSNHKNYTPVFMEAHNRFKLFRILDQNYKEWDSYINLLRGPETRDYDNDFLQLDRLLLNCLTAAYTIQEHFQVSFMRRFRKNAGKLKEHDDFINGLCQNFWEFAFFLDFRNHVQHCGLGIGRFNRQTFLNHAEICVVYDAAQLFAENKNWKRCKLTGKEGELNLIELLKKFHLQILQNYGGYVAKIFFPELIPATQFYANLTDEVRKINPEFKMFFGVIQPEENTNPLKAKLSLKFVPNDVLAELGISISIKD